EVTSWRSMRSIANTAGCPGCSETTWASQIFSIIFLGGVLGGIALLIRFLSGGIFEVSIHVRSINGIDERAHRRDLDIVVGSRSFEHISFTVDDNNLRDALSANPLDVGGALMALYLEAREFAINRL